MKQLSKYINETLNCSHSEHIFEYKLKHRPKTWSHLLNIVALRCKENIENPNLNGIDLSQMTEPLYELFSAGFDGVYPMTAHDVDVSEFKRIDLSSWDISNKNINDLSYMFYWNENLEFVDLSGWDTSNIINMSGMFYACKNLKEIKGIENFNVKHHPTMTNMFKGCEKLTLPIWYDKKHWEKDDEEVYRAD